MPPLAERSAAPIQRRIVRRLAAVQLISGVGTSIGVASAGLAVVAVASEKLGGLGQTLLLVGTTVGALLVARVSHTSGRRPALTTAFALAALGAAVVCLALWADLLLLLILGLLIFGFGSSASYSARYAAMDLAIPERRARDASLVMFFTAVGSFIGPQIGTFISGGTEDLRTSLIWSFGTASIAFTSVAVAMFFALQPDPLILARTLQKQEEPADSGTKSSQTKGSSLNSIFKRSDAIYACFSVVIAHGAMVTIMAASPLAIMEHGGSYSESNLVISVHLAGMYLFSPAVGSVVSRVGSKKALMASTLLMAAATMILLPFSHSLPVMVLSLFLIGLAWSGGILAGAALLVDSVLVDERATAQGTVDVLMDIAAVVGSLGSGLAVALGGIEAIAIPTTLALLFFPVVRALRRSRWRLSR